MSGYPALYREIGRMIDDRALEKKMATSIARRGGFVQGAFVTPETGRTLIDCWVDVTHPKESRQWDVDLSGCTDIRFINRGATNIFLVYSVSGFGSQILDPGDYALFPTLFPDDPYGYPTAWLEAFSGNSEIDGGNPWARIPEAQRVPMRLSFSLGAGVGQYWGWTSAGWGTDDFNGGFAVGVEVR